MSNKTTKEALEQYDRLLLLTSLILTLLLALIYYFADSLFKKAGDETIAFAKNLIVEFFPVGVTFIISYYIFRKVQELKDKQMMSDLTNGIVDNLLPKIINSVTVSPNYQLVEFSKINWEELLYQALSVDIIVHYFDTWIRNNDKLLEDIFSKNGTIRIIVPNGENKLLVKAIKARFPEYDEKLVKSKIHGTKEKLLMIKKRVRNGKLEIYETNELGYYCGVRIDEKYLVFSGYDHVRNNMRIEAPTFVIRLDEQENMNKWFSKEFEGIKKENYS